MRALQQLGLADVYGETRVPLYVLNVAYPADRRRDGRVLPRQVGGADGRRGRSPNIIEQALNTMLRRRDIQTKVCRQGRAADGRRIYRAGR